MEENILLVLSIIEGRHFPKRPHHKLVIEAKFDGEFLTTDLIKHNDNPQFNTELAWEIDKKLLHQHKLQRTPIKLQVYAVESTNLSKELVGYCVLDIRSAQLDGKKKGEWASLLNSKYQSLKPEIKTSLILEIDQVKNEDQSSKKAKSILSNQSELEVVLDQENGYYLIGQQCDECKIFVLSVSIGGAKNLIKLLSPNSNICSETGYYFYYSLFGNDVTNETFYDLLSTSIPTERATVRICTTSDKLFNYLKRKNFLEIFFCCGENYLGKTTVSLDSLLVDQKFSSSLSLEGMFPILTMASSSSDAMLGVSVVLKREEAIQEPNVSPVIATKAQKNPSAPYDANNLKQNFVKKSSKIDESQNNPSNEIPMTPPRKPEKAILQIKQSTEKIQHHQNHQDRSSEVNHHFSFSIDLRSLSNDSYQFPLNVVCRYVYSFFGSSSPVITHPPIIVNRGSEVLLPNSFCKFEFASSFQLLQTTFNRVPLLVEIWHKEVNMKDTFIGLAQIRLADVLLNQNTSIKNGPSIKSSRVPVVSADDPSKRIGNIHVVIGLEDHGEVLTKIQVHSSASQTDSVDNTISEHLIEPPRKTQEYQVAIALEMWKHQQEELFKEQLQKKENERMKVLAEEWKLRDMEREMILNKKLDEYRTLESKLKTTLQEVESHQKDLDKRESDLASKERLLKEDYSLKANEMHEASKRLKEQCQHQIYLEQLHFSEIEEKYKKVVEQLHEAENKLKERENDIYRLKESMLSRPEVKLQSEMHLLLLEKNELERKIEAVSKSKVHYKQQWGRALRELARLKTGEQEAAKVRLKRQHDELEHMKLRYLAAEENKVIGKEKQELVEAKEEITKSKLEELEMVRNQNNSTRYRINDYRDDKITPERNYGTEKSRIAKLIDERDTLLQTGVYTTEDRVINELDKEIQHLISAYR